MKTKYKFTGRYINQNGIELYEWVGFNYIGRSHMFWMSIDEFWGRNGSK